MNTWRERAQRLKTEMVAVTPVDFLPDVVPILGFIDDLIFIPLVLGIAGKFVPDAVLVDRRGRAQLAVVAIALHI